MKFNIEDYLNSLPLNTRIIDVSGRGLIYLPDLSNFINLKKLYCAYNNLTKLPPLNENLEILSCSHNFLKCLPPLNQKLKTLDCSFNNLYELPFLNESLKILNCSYNCLCDLPSLNNNLKQLYCQYNKINELPELNINLRQLNCAHNKLTKLPNLNIKLEELTCIENNIKWLPPINNYLYYIYFDIEIYNYNIYNNNPYSQCFVIKILKKFRYTYYAVKFKQQFKRWLWEKVREPKIMKKFHPDYLNELKETDDLEVFLNEWVNK
jgi:Leucine-rich repeat (LRR) protein